MERNERTNCYMYQTDPVLFVAAAVTDRNGNTQIIDN